MTTGLKTTKTDHLYTAEEFETLPEFDDRYELIEGRLVEKRVPGQEHAYIIDVIRDAIKFFDPQRKLGYSLQETSVVLGSHSVPTPDISYWKAERRIKITKKAGPLPDLAVEVHSPNDLKGQAALSGAMVKVRKLVEAGVPLVWVVYPDRQAVEVYRAERPFAAGPVQTLGLGQTLDGQEVIPGFELPVAALFNYEQ